MSTISTDSFRRRTPVGKGDVTLKVRTYLTAEGKAVPAGQPGGVSLLGGPGKVIRAAQAQAVGLATDADAYPQHLGGGVYELSDGSRVKGRADADAAEKLLGAAEDKAATPGEDKSS